MNRKEAVAAGEKWYTPAEPCTKCHTLADRYVANGRCVGCNPSYLQRSRPTEPDRSRAVAAGEKWYTPVNDCQKCGTKAPRRVSDGKCSGCHPSAYHPHEPNRGRAKRAGHKIYLPEHTCTKCGIKAPRWTSNNRCMGCTSRPMALSIILIAQYPDMVIQRRDAQALGLIYYQNPYRCQHGHKDWSSVTTGECLSCRPPRWMS